MKKPYLLALLVLIHPAINLSINKTETANVPLPPKFIVQDFVLQDDAKQRILEHNLWDKKRGIIVSREENKKQKTKKNGWQLKAVKNIEFAIIESKGALKKYYPDDQLPDESYLKEILFDGIVIQREEEIEYVYLFGKKHQ